MSSESTVKASQWRNVEVGRVILINRGADAGKLAVIVEIIDHKRVLIDGPSSGVARQAFSVAQSTLTPIVVPVPRGAKSATIAKKWEAAGVDEKWNKSSWAAKIAQKAKRSQLSDFDRFKVLVLKKQKRYAVQKALAKA